MERKNHIILHIIRSEWRKVCKTPIQLVLILVMPFVLMLFLFWGLHTVKANTNSYDGLIYCVDDEQVTTCKSLMDRYPSFSCEVGDTDKAKTKIHAGKADVILVIHEEDICVVYDSSLLASSNAMKDATALSSELCFLLEDEALHTSFLRILPQTQLIDLSTTDEKLNSALDQVIGVLGMILFLSMASNAMTLAGHSITGEKERQTFDTLVLCPTPLQKILSGKTIVVGTQVFLAGFMGCAGAVAGFYMWSHEEFQLIASQVGGDIQWILILLILLISNALLITGIFTIISSAFPETKKSALFGSLGMIVISVASMIPTFADWSAFRYIPIANFSLIMKETCKHHVDYVPVLMSVVLSILVCILCVLLSRKLWERSHE